jgi:carboxyl-terminal processing protease
MQKRYIAMFSKKSVPIILILLLVCVSFLYAVKSNRKSSDNPTSKYEKILRTVTAYLEQGHYSPQRVDDNFSEKVFNKYINIMDGDKGYFLQGDVDSLRALYAKSIDDEMHGAELKSFYGISQIYTQRMTEASVLFKSILSKPFDFTVKESVDMNYDKMKFAATPDERYDRWRKRLKYLVLERYVELLDARDKNKGKDSIAPKTDQELEQQARTAIYKIMDRNFARLKSVETSDAQFNELVNCITNTMDPHTDFFPPVERRSFDELMSGRFYGIGASLSEDDAGNITIQSLVTGSPAWKSQKINAGDIILKVAQGNDTAQDLTGYAREDAVKLIRGGKGTVVKLTIKKADGSIVVVPLVRDEIVLDDTFARAAIINDGDRKLGYIYLPEFYADFEHPTGNRCSVDVAKELSYLKNQKVDGVIMDLRGNGGGSLVDVVKMVGLFIPSGPVVQVKGRNDDPQTWPDPDHGILYSGPLTVMVNEGSASASEIFAAAIQDYHRGLILGSDTYGKGTVQRELPLDPKVTGDNVAGDSALDLGSIKLTLQKFYRISGGSTQLKGVSPDIPVPDRYEYLKERERDNPDALKWDEIAKVSYQPWQPPYDVTQVKKESEDRLDRNASFKDILKNAKWIEEQNDKNYSLEIAQYRKERDELNKVYKEIDANEKLPAPLTMTMMPPPNALDGAGELADTSASKMGGAPSVRAVKNAQWLSLFQSDLELGEAVNVMNDMVRQNNVAKQ